MEHRLTAMETISITPPASATVGQSMQKQARTKLERALGWMLLFLLVFSFSSCKKDAETFKMAGTWALDSYSENGVDRTAYFKETFVNYRIKFDKGKTFVETATVAGIDINMGGSWKVLSDGGSMELIYSSENAVRVLELVEVKGNSSIIMEHATGKEFCLNKM